RFRRTRMNAMHTSANTPAPSRIMVLLSEPVSGAAWISQRANMSMVRTELPFSFHPGARTRYHDRRHVAGNGDRRRRLDDNRPRQLARRCLQPAGDDGHDGETRLAQPIHSPTNGLG